RHHRGCIQTGAGVAPRLVVDSSSADTRVVVRAGPVSVTFVVIHSDQGINRLRDILTMIGSVHGGVSRHAASCERHCHRGSTNGSPYDGSSHRFLPIIGRGTPLAPPGLATVTTG